MTASFAGEAVRSTRMLAERERTLGRSGTAYDQLATLLEAQNAEIEQLRAQRDHLQARGTQLLLETRSLRRGESTLRGQVAAFMHASDQPTRETPGAPPDAIVRLRAELILEEAFEFLAACVPPADRWLVDRLWELHARTVADLRRGPVRPDLPAIADALADLAYVTEGACLAFGIDPGPVLDAVHASNMAKTIGPRRTDPATGKILKPAGWTPPDIRAALAAQGWAP